ncbi:DUF1275 domain-containing protein [Altererythrobacter aerius]|uniref:DUF1275 domain-containing protein n=1 Tax=Tsuneonella aeria TaxID=1837929 RepID=A0A6I4TEK4_9SPHN|nr:YoaK family protein [Tsuneonella aeria]MXO75016.1 DUF1275 domain-containing protein [Tsuneonella aeria]
MLRYERDKRVLAMGYAALAGAVDAIGFLKSGGLFVSFMTGNSTRLAVGLAETAPVGAAAAALIALFVTGVILSVVISESVIARYRKVTATLVVATVLIAAAAADSFGSDRLAIACLCIAMGAANAIFRRDGEVSIGVTYMTGTLVKLGHRLADALRGSHEASWLPYLLLWLSLVAGGITGALGFVLAANASLWGTAIASMSLVIATWWVTREREPPGIS